MKKLGLILLIFSIVLFTGCTRNDTQTFKEEYESLNGQTNSSGLKHRDVSISNKNPFFYSTGEEIVSKIENKETFYVYFGSSYCPWCRSVIEKFIEVANKNNIDKVYYVDIWEGDHQEIFRDVYELNEKNEPILKFAGTEVYHKLLNYLDPLLNNYTLTSEDGKSISVNEKRIFAPDFIYIEKGIAKKIETGISQFQKSSRESFTEEILQDEEQSFQNFFTK